MKKLLQSKLLSTGLAMFSMFFGAGNVVWPLALGRMAGDQNLFSIAGLLITAVAVPFLGLIGMMLFEGNYKNYLFRIGKMPGFLMAVLIVAIIGPFGALPRCITLSYSAIKDYLPGVTLLGFSLISAFIIFLFSIKENKILDILGYFLSPILLLSLITIIIKGFISAPMAIHTDFLPTKLFWEGLTTGYQTMDLLAAMFFSAVVLTILKRNFQVRGEKDYKKLTWFAIKAGSIAIPLLGVIYLGMSYVASFYSSIFGWVPDEELLTAIAHHLLGAGGGIVVSIAVALACLTTAIALAAVSAEFIKRDLFASNLSYSLALVVTLILSVATSTLKFQGIKQVVAPILSVCYPALIVLAVLNIAYKFFDFRMVKIPFFATLLVSVAISYFPAMMGLISLS